MFLCFSASAASYDPQYCYILDGILLLYGIIITAFFVRERPLQKKTEETYREIETKPGRRRPDQVYQGLSSVTKDTYDSLNMQQIHPPPR
ncbi:T-cell surface glyco CD3 zeta chain [Labeo rohita]|uniref:High affinity immunoglobulin epsilon receptor subunit gamma n=1 Tax=Labeo rohita TaxID=84645 RepID=A0A498P5L3_LABRO|nr:T-cell surface glyco CD3 zeta chain [Labeo rohita]